MVKTTQNRGSHFLGRVPKNVKFEVVETLEDGSFLSWIAPDGQSKKKGAQRIPVRVIEYTIAQERTGTDLPLNYRFNGHH